MKLVYVKSSKIGSRLTPSLALMDGDSILKIPEVEINDDERRELNEIGRVLLAQPPTDDKRS